MSPSRYQHWTPSSSASSSIYIVQSSLYASILGDYSFESILPKDELIRASRYLNLEARQRYLCGRIILRALLASVMQQLPRDIVILRSAGGKPSLARPGGASVEFSLSHCSGGLAIAMSSRPVGIDIEAAEPRNWQRVATRYFSAREQAWLHSSDDPDAAFRSLWTAKESLVKLVDGSLPAILRVDCLPAVDGDSADDTACSPGAAVSVLTFTQTDGTSCSLASYADEIDRIERNSVTVFSLQDDEWSALDLPAVSRKSLILPSF